MKTKLSVLAAALIVATSMLSAQSITHPWKVIDAGGGKSAGGGMTLAASVGQPEAQPMSAPGFSLEGGYIPGIRTLTGTVTTSSMHVDASWNMISVPLIVEDFTKDSLFPTSISSAFRYANGYIAEDTLNNGAGYWLKFGSTQTIQMAGSTLPFDTLDVAMGWNMIGMISYPALISDVVPIPPVTILSDYFGFRTDIGYFSEDTLKPGGAYWVKVSSLGRIVINSGSVLSIKPPDPPADNSRKGSISVAATLAEEQEVNTLVFKDADNHERRLYFSATLKDFVIDRCELPPPPPEGIFDVRFHSGRALEVADFGGRAEQEFPVNITGLKLPLTILWQTNDTESEFTFALSFAGEEQQEFPLKDRGSIVVTQPGLVGATLGITPREIPELPKEFSLHQNYPNPFNPTTTITYDLPTDAQVTLRAYDILGREVMTLVNEVQNAGFKHVEWKPDRNASGVYFFRLEAVSLRDQGDYTATKKAILLK